MTFRSASTLIRAVALSASALVVQGEAPVTKDEMVESAIG
jgi:hypothetical protein